MKTIRTMLVLCIVGVYFSFNPAEMFGAAAGMSQHNREIEKVDGQEEADDLLHLSIILERMYVDNEMSEERIVESFPSLEACMEKYQEWDFVEVRDGAIVLQRDVDDISPLLKTNGYFGVTTDGVLTIFNGKPNGSNVIQSFFQLDMEKLESNDRDCLKNGIRIKNRTHYGEVLEAFQQLRPQSN